MESTPIMLAADPELARRFGPMTLDRRSRASNLFRLAGGFAEFTSELPSDPVTLVFEELILVLEGEIRLTVDNESVVATAGELIALEEGATVVFAGTLGSRIFLAVTPADWEALD